MASSARSDEESGAVLAPIAGHGAVNGSGSDDAKDGGNLKVPVCVKLAAVLAMCAVQASFGGYFILTKRAVSGGATNPLIFALIRDSGGAFLLVCAALAQGGRHALRFDLADLPLFLLEGLAGIYFGQLMPAVALQHISALNVSVLQPAAPIGTFVLAALLGMEPVNVRSWPFAVKICGLIMAVAGAVIVIATSSKSSGDSQKSKLDYIVGNSIIILQVLFTSVYMCTQKVLLRKYKPLPVAALCYCCGVVLVVLGIFPSGILTDPSAWHVPPSGAVAVVYAIVISSGLGYATMAWSTSKVSPALVTTTTTLNPIATAILGYVFLGKSVTTGDVLGGSLVILGLLALVLAKMKEWRTADAAGKHGRVEESQSLLDSGKSR